MNMANIFAQQITQRFRTGHTGRVDMIKRARENTTGAQTMAVLSLT
jgi:hypothetical protein